MRVQWLTLAAALAAVILTQFEGLDVGLSDYFYNETTRSWPIEHATSNWRIALYDGPKALFILLWLLLIGFALCPGRFRSSKHIAEKYLSHREALFLILCLSVVPSTVGIIKKNSGVSCPYAMERYGGKAIDSSGHFHANSFALRDDVVGCWPSGHASGGFALIGFVFLARSRRIRTRLAVTSLTTGSAMGTYQVLRGAHFISHIIITLCAAIILISIIYIVFPPAPSRSRSSIPRAG